MQVMGNFIAFIISLNLASQRTYYLGTLQNEKNIHSQVYL